MNIKGIFISILIISLFPTSVKAVEPKSLMNSEPGTINSVEPHKQHTHSGIVQSQKKKCRNNKIKKQPLTEAEEIALLNKKVKKLEIQCATPAAHRKRMGAVDNVGDDYGINYSDYNEDYNEDQIYDATSYYESDKN